jgi:ArsR family transcriptional regulator
VHYKIVVLRDTGAAKVLKETLAVLKEDRGMQADLNPLNKACCSPQKPAALDGAPLPTTVAALACTIC